MKMTRARRGLIPALLVFFIFLVPTSFSDLDTTYFRIAADGVVAVIGYPSNSPPILSAMLDSGLWTKHIIEIKKVDKIDVVLYNMEQLAFESSALPLVNKPLITKDTYLAFDQSKGIARPDVAIGGINEILESVKMTTDTYMQYIIISQSADFRDARMREFNSILPFFANAKLLDSKIDSSAQKKFLCLIGSPKAHKIIFGALLHHHGLLRKSIEWSAGSFVGDTAREVRDEAKKRTEFDKLVDISAFDKFASKLPNIIDVDPSVEKQHTELNADLYSRGRIHIILESEDHSPDVELCDMQFRYTEKTIKSMFFGYPFLVYGNFGTLKLLQTHGFQTFHPYINETYDLIPFRHQRVHALLSEISRINSLEESAFDTLLSNLQPITKFNQQMLGSKELKEKLRMQGEYALGLTNEKATDYTELDKIAENALKLVNAPACSNLPAAGNCNPVCGYTIYQKEDNHNAEGGGITNDVNKKDEVENDENEDGTNGASSNSAGKNYGNDADSHSRKPEANKESHQLVFEDAEGRVIKNEDEASVTETNVNTPKPLKDDIIIKPAPKAKGLEKKKHENDDDTLAGVLSEANSDLKDKDGDGVKDGEENKDSSRESESDQKESSDTMSLDGLSEDSNIAGSSTSETMIKEDENVGDGKSGIIGDTHEISGKDVIEPVPLRNKAIDAGSAIEAEKLSTAVTPT